MVLTDALWTQPKKCGHPCYGTGEFSLVSLGARGSTTFSSGPPKILGWPCMRGRVGAENKKRGGERPKDCHGERAGSTGRQRDNTPTERELSGQDSGSRSVCSSSGDSAWDYWGKNAPRIENITSGIKIKTARGWDTHRLFERNSKTRRYSANLLHFSLKWRTTLRRKVWWI